MDLEKYKVEVGRFIKETRQSQKISQKRLITDENGHQIISEKTLIEIEKGRKTPRPDTLNLLLQKLNKDMLDVLFLFEDNNRLRFENRVCEIRSLINEEKCEQANLYYKQLEAEDWYDRKNPKISQALLYLKGCIYGDLYKEADLSLELFQKSLKQTRPLIFHPETGQIQLDDSTALTKIEYILLINIGIHYGDKDEMENAVRIFNIIIASVTSDAVDIEMRDSILNQVYFLLSDGLLNLERYHDALAIINQGIALCEKTQIAQNLGYLHYNKGITLYCLGDVVAAFVCFEQSKMVFKALNQQEHIDICKNYAKMDLGIDI